MATANWQSLGAGDPVRDYRHAARIFGSNDFARAPKSKYLFYVVISINPNATSDNYGSAPDFKSELSYLVKTVELPKFEFEIQENNQYNKKVLSQKQIKYNPITIKFHDDNYGTLRDFWQAYYNYYYMDGRYTENDFKVDDKFQRRADSGVSNRWGLDTNPKSPFLLKIDIYSMYQAKAEKITLENPLIQSFSHDSHDYAENTGIMEATMSFRYTGVRYEADIDASNGIAGFGQTAPEAYDTVFSSLTDGSGNQYDSASGTFYDPTVGNQSTNYGPTTNWNPNYGTQLNNFNSYNPTIPSYITNAQLASILLSGSNKPVNYNYRFPSITNNPTVFQDHGALPLEGSLAVSDQVLLPTPIQLNAVYNQGSWQNSLYQKGYSQDQISGAAKYVSSINLSPTTNVTQIAETYIQNSKSPKLEDYGVCVFGQPNKTPSKIDFSNVTASSQPTYNSQNWQYQLEQKGYNKSDINSAGIFLSQLKVAPGTDLSAIASNYIINSKVKGLPGSAPTTTVAQTTNTNELKGPNFNPVAPGTNGSGIRPDLYKNI
jgi:hypothetical protein